MHSADPASRRLVRTVTGDIDAAELGATNYHEHLFQVSRLLPGEDLDDESRSENEARMLRSSGFTAMIDATPIGLGRRPTAVRRIAEAADLHVVATTGVHKQEHYADDHWALSADEDTLAGWFVADIEGGMPTSDDAPRGSNKGSIRAGVIKVGIGYWRISAFERRAIAAAGVAHARTGAPVMVHLDHGSAGLEVLTTLADAGVPADAVVLAHIDRNPDPYVHAELATAGAYLGYDGFARHREWPDAVLIRCLCDTAGAGGLNRILVGGDVARRSRYRAYDGMPGLGYLGERILPRLRRELGASDLRRILVDNPATFLGRFTRRAPDAAGSGEYNEV